MNGFFAFLSSKDVGPDPEKVVNSLANPKVVDVNKVSTDILFLIALRGFLFLYLWTLVLHNIGNPNEISVINIITTIVAAYAGFYLIFPAEGSAGHVGRSLLAQRGALLCLLFGIIGGFIMWTFFYAADWLGQGFIAKVFLSIIAWVLGFMIFNGLFLQLGRLKVVALVYKGMAHTICISLFVYFLVAAQHGPVAAVGAISKLSTIYILGDDAPSDPEIINYRNKAEVAVKKFSGEDFTFKVGRGAYGYNSKHDDRYPVFSYGCYLSAKFDERLGNYWTGTFSGSDWSRGKLSVWSTSRSKTNACKSALHTLMLELKRFKKK